MNGLHRILLSLEEFKNQILQEVKELENVPLIRIKHGVSTNTIFTWISKSNNKDKIEVANKYINAGYFILLVLKIIKFNR